MKKRIAWMCAAVMVWTVSAVSLAYAQKQPFIDVSENHWAAEAISWGAEHKVLAGYGDGSFAPGKSVTEAEFLKMVVSAYESLPDQGVHWYDKYYAYAFEKGWYVNGLKDQSLVDTPIKRKEAAIILSSALGNSYPDDRVNSTQLAINELYDKGLSNGKTEKTVEGFAPDESLTRAEAVQFVYNFAVKSGVKTLRASISDADWAPFEKVDFSDEQGLLEKHQLFARKYGLTVLTYHAGEWNYFNLTSASEPSTESSESTFDLSSAYKVDTDGTITWNLTADLDKVDVSVIFELLTRIFSYDSTYHDSIKEKLIPTIEYKGVKVDGQFHAAFGNLDIVTRYDEPSNHYYFSSVAAPLQEGSEIDE